MQYVNIMTAKIENKQPSAHIIYNGKSIADVHRVYRFIGLLDLSRSSWGHQIWMKDSKHLV